MLNPLLAHEVTRAVHQDRMRQAEARHRTTLPRPKRTGLFRRRPKSEETAPTEQVRNDPDPVLAA